jgi:hypothetical protein
MSWNNCTLLPNFRRISVTKAKFVALVKRSLGLLLSQAFVSEALCQITPKMDVFQSIACGCNSSAEFSASCAERNFSLYGLYPAEVARVQAVPGTSLVLRFVSGWVRIPDPGPQESARDVSLSLVESSDFWRGGDLPAGNDTLQDCARFQVVQDTSGGVMIGQIIGSGVRLDGLSGQAVLLCLRTNPSMNLCREQYPVVDFASPDPKDAVTLVPLQTRLAVNNRTEEYCGWVNASEGLVVIPVRRTADMAQYRSPPSRQAWLVVGIGLPSRLLFTDARRWCLKTAVAAVSGGILSSEDVQITDVCDSPACDRFKLGYRAGITVTLQVRGV